MLCVGLSVRALFAYWIRQSLYWERTNTKRKRTIVMLSSFGPAVCPTKSHERFPKIGAGEQFSPSCAHFPWNHLWNYNVFAEFLRSVCIVCLCVECVSVFVCVPSWQVHLGPSILIHFVFDRDILSTLYTPPSTRLRDSLSLSLHLCFKLPAQKRNKSETKQTERHRCDEIAKL